MNRSLLTSLILRIALFSLACVLYLHLGAQNQMAWTAAGHGYGVGGDRDAISSNVPLNEINTRAFRHFRKNFPEIWNEAWLKTDRGYIVSFMNNAQRNQAHYDLKGVFLYAVKYYTGKDMPMDARAPLIRNYPGYAIDAVTEITNGEKIFYIVKIENPESIKTLSICDGKIALTEDLVNGG